MMVRDKKLLSTMVISMLVFGVLSLPGYTRSLNEKVLKIGVVGPESGGSAQLGQAQHKAVQMAVEEINASKGAGDWKLEAYFEDDEGNPTKSANATNKLLQKSEVNVIIGAINSSCTLADMVYTERAGIPQITAGSTGADITGQGKKWIFRTAVNDEFQANALVKYAVNVLGIKKVATLTAADDYGQSGAKLLKAAADKYGLELVATLTYNNGDKDFKPQLLTIKDKGAKGIFLWGLYTEAALIARQAQQLGVNSQLFGASGMAAMKLMELGEQAVEGMVLTQSFLPNSWDPKVKDFVTKYRQKYNEDPIPHAAQAYDTVYILADAIKRSKSMAPAKLREAISKTSWLQLVTGSPRFNGRGDDVGKRLLITKIQDGKFVFIKAVTAGE
ncbi:MAG: ABC transporter substrate-binding protein [Firmicutes bacterium]|nr:ABC transporter substrate-binding protein [Bacillota bacterium]